MNKTIFFLILVFILLIIGVSIYTFYEKEQFSTQTFVNISLYAVNQETKLNEITNYIVGLNSINNVYKNGTTLIGGAALIQIPANNTVYIKNINKDEQIYYEVEHQIPLYELKSYRVVLELEQPEMVNITQFGELLYEENITLILKSKNFKNVNFCTKWSSHFIRVNTNFPEITKLDRFKNMDKCYSTNSNLNINNQINLIFSYTTIANINSNDFIKIIVYDGDENINNDYEYEININNI